MTEYSINVDADGEPYGGEWAGVYNPYMYGMLDAFGYDGLTITDWGVYEIMGVWGAEDMERSERIALGWERGANLLGGFNGLTGGGAGAQAEAYRILVEDVGEEEALSIMSKAAYKFILVMMNLNMFDQPYCDSAYADSIVYSESSNAYGLETQRQSVVMIKNDGTIAEGGSFEGKPKAYIPWVYNDGFSVGAFQGISQGAGSWSAGLDLDIMGEYFDIVTDTLGEPSGEEGAYTVDDIIRAEPDEIAACDLVLMGMPGAYTAPCSRPPARPRARTSGIPSLCSMPPTPRTPPATPPSPDRSLTARRRTAAIRATPPMPAPWPPLWTPWPMPPTPPGISP